MQKHTYEQRKLIRLFPKIMAGCKKNKIVAC